MNVSREEFEQWVLKASVCSIRSLTICAAAVPSAVAPGICDSVRPAKYPAAARSAGHARKPLPRPSGAWMLCFPGCSVWSVARHGGGDRTDERVTGMHTRDLCKVNYTITVKEIMTCGPVDVSRGARLLPIVAIFSSTDLHAGRSFELTTKRNVSIIIFTLTLS